MGKQWQRGGKAAKWSEWSWGCGLVVAVWWGGQQPKEMGFGGGRGGGGKGLKTSKQEREGWVIVVVVSWDGQQPKESTCEPWTEWSAHAYG